MKRYVSDERIDEYFAGRGMTRVQAEANLRRRYPKYTAAKIFEEIQVGPLCEDALAAIKKCVDKNPNFFAEMDGQHCSNCDAALTPCCECCGDTCDCAYTSDELNEAEFYYGNKDYDASDRSAYDSERIAKVRGEL